MKTDGSSADDRRFDTLLDDLLFALGGKLATDPLDLAVLKSAGVGFDGNSKGLQLRDELLVLDPELLGQFVYSHLGHSRNPRKVWFNQGLRLFPRLSRCRPLPCPGPAWPSP